MAQYVLGLSLSQSGKELQRLLKEHGDFGALEIQIAKKSIKSDKNTHSGGWYTKAYLEKHEHWTKTHSSIKFLEQPL